MKSRFLSFCFLCALTFSVCAEESSSSEAELQKLTWTQCVEEAAKKNPELESTWQAFQNADFTRKASYSDFFPQLSASASGERSYSTADSSGGGGGGFSSTAGKTEYTTEYTGNLTLQQMLFDGFKTKGNVDQARAKANLALASLAQEKAVISYELKSAFAQLLYAQELVSISQDIVSRRDLNARLVELRYDSGKENKGALLLSKANNTQAQSDLGQAQRNLDVSQRQLSSVMGRDVFTPILIEGELETAPVPPQPDFAALAFKTPSHFQREAEAKAAAAGVTIAQSAWYPQISATASTSVRGDQLVPNRDSWSVGVSGSLNVFDWGNTYFNVRAARASLLQSLATLRSNDNDTTLSLAQDFASMIDAIENVRVQKEKLDAYTLRVKIAEEQYRNGLISFQDFDTITNDYINQQRTTLTSRRDAVIAEANWEQSRGVGVIP